MKLFWFTVYNFIALPILLVLVLFLYPFKSKIRRALHERRGMTDKLRNFISQIDSKRIDAG